MTFLDPTSGLIAAAIAGPALLTLYFLKLRRRPLRVSSTLLWEQAVKDLQVNVPLRWLKVSVILLLQLAALAAFVIALARPAVQGPAPVADHVVIVIDHTASMSARDGNVTGVAAESRSMRLDEAKQKAREYAGSLTRSSGLSGGQPLVQVISSSAQARIRCAYTSDLREVQEQIDAIEPTDQAGEGGGGVAAAIKLLSASVAATEDARDLPEVVIFSDAPLPRGQVTALPMRVVLVGGKPGPVSASSVAAPTGDTTAPPLSPGSDNIGIVALNARRDAAEPETIRIFARLQSAAAQSKSISIRMFVDEALAITQRVEVPAAPADVPLSLTAKHAESCTIIVSIDDDDLLAADNTAAIRLDAAANPAVLIVAAERNGKVDPDPFLVGAIESTRPRRIRTIGKDDYEAECVTARDERRRAWNTFNLVIFDRVEPNTVPPQPSISIGAGLPIDGLRLAAMGSVRETPTSGVMRFTTWRRSHPLLRYVGLDPIIAAPPPLAIDTDAKSPSSPGASIVVPLAFGLTASAADAPIIAGLERAGAEQTSGKPASLLRVVVSFPLSRSNWGPDHSFPVFISNAVDLLTGLGEAAVGRSWTTSEPVIAQPAPDAREITVQSSGPNAAAPTRITISPPTTSQTAAPVGLGTFPLAGIYRLVGCEQPVACINLLSADETLLPPGSARAESPANALTATSPPAADRNDEPRPGQREVWHWFLLAGLAIAAIEWIAFARGMRA